MRLLGSFQHFRKFIPAATHAAKDDEPRVGSVLVCIGARRVGLPRGRAGAVAGGHVPLHHRRVGAQLQRIEVVQVARDVVLGVLGVVGEPAEEIHLIFCEKK